MHGFIILFQLLQQLNAGLSLLTRQLNSERVSSLFGFSSSRRITPGNRINHELLLINLVAVAGGRFSNAATSQRRKAASPQS